MRLSILDYVPVDEGLTAADALAASLRLAQTADAARLHRYWFSEHHGMPAMVSSAPEMMMARTAAATDRIRLGSGGVLIPNHSSMKIAENFQLLEAMFPDRIDLGFGRAPGANQRVNAALNDERSNPLPYGNKVADLLGFLRGQAYGASPHAGLKALPETARPPQTFVLGASGSTAELAAQAGLGFTFAHFINPGPQGAQAAAAYRAAFQPSLFGQAPSVVVAVFVAVGETEAKARDYADAFHLWLSHAESAQPFDRLPALDTARRHDWTLPEQMARQRNEGRLISGTADSVAAQLQDLGQAYGTDEVMVNLMMPGEAARQTALTSLAEALSLAPQAELA
ncbi:MsnO8 family LLM class oxidoreductase [Salipiger abyssi]|uniref:MsnO8 family LLM class oxidoreductase n=1 Tax=Salipiger abyssi TaxID=1250539 RepID=UPI004058D199